MPEVYRFAELVASKLDTIIENFRRGLSKRGYAYNHDIFTDTYAKCDRALKGRLLEEKEIMRYLWTAYVNGYKDSVRASACLPIEGDMADDGEQYETEKDTIFVYLDGKIRERFDVEIHRIWSEHVYMGKTYTQIKTAGCGTDRPDHAVAKVKRYIVKELVPGDPYLRELLSCAGIYV